jgi:hypothetical protein
MRRRDASPAQKRPHETAPAGGRRGPCELGLGGDSRAQAAGGVPLDTSLPTAPTKKQRSAKIPRLVNVVTYRVGKRSAHMLDS